MRYPANQETGQLSAENSPKQNETGDLALKVDTEQTPVELIAKGRQLIVGNYCTLSAEMSDHENVEEHGGVTEGDTHESHSHHSPMPPPFNPLPSHNSQAAIGNSVVPDLMKVYESMTQSSTPQTDIDPTSGSESAYELSNEHQASYDPYQRYVPAAATNGDGQATYYATPATYYVPPPESYTGPTPDLPPVPEYPPPTAELPQPDEPEPPREPEPDPELPDEEIPDEEIPDDTPSDAAAANTTSISGRSLRKRSLDRSNSTASDKNSAKSRRKGNTTDARWAKRFAWPDDLHRDFVSAIFDVGLKHSSPSAILEHMPKCDQITSERIKSHLQKYRVHRTKSKKEFMTSYDASLSKFKSDGVEGSKSLASGEVAAHLSYSTMTDADEKEESKKVEEKPPTPKPKDTTTKLILPQLTEDEKKSPVGTSLGYLMGLFFSLRQQLLAQRAAQAAVAGVKLEGEIDVAPAVDSQVGAMYSHFASDMPHYTQDAVWQTAADAAAAGYDAEGKLDAKAPPSTRSNFEENKLMKQEMKNQMAIQNKMRDLKQRELNKYKSVPDSGHEKDDEKMDLTPNPVDTGDKEVSAILDKDANDESTRSQGAGETAEAGDRGRPRGLSVGVSDEFWNSDVVDEQLFEFLMNP